MRKSSENIARDLENIIHETIKMCQPEKIFPPYLKNICIRPPYGMLSIGKAAVSMAEVFLTQVTTPPDINCVITSNTYIPANTPENLSIYKAEHPYPGKKTVHSSRTVLDKILTEIPENGQVILLLSGGGSSLFEIPQSHLSISDIACLTKELMEQGADIEALNTVRKHLSAVKGGKLAQILYPREILAFIMSDVMGDKLDFIASGPVTPDTTTPSDAKRILSVYGLNPELIREEKDVRAHKEFKHVTSTIISNNQILIDHCVATIRKKGYPCRPLHFPLTGEASECGQTIAQYIKSQSIEKPVYFVTGGETGVTLRGKGKGGRSMELVLQAALELSETPFNWGLASVGSDGIDGPTDAAGAFITRDMVTFDNQTAGRKALRNNDSYTFFKSMHSLIKTGYTGINLNDLFIAYIE